MAGTKEFHELISALRSQFEKVKALAAFLDLKQSELRPGDEVSFFGILQAKEQLTIETSILSGHTYLLRTELHRRHVVLNPKTRHFLEDVTKKTKMLYRIR